MVKKGDVDGLIELARELSRCTPAESICHDTEEIIRYAPGAGVVPSHIGFYGDFRNSANVDAIVIGENPGRTTYAEKLFWRRGAL